MQTNFEQVVEQVKLLPLSDKQELRRFLDEQIALSDRETKREQSAAWRKANRARYGGLYVALDGDCLIATGKNYGEAREAATRAGIADAVVDFLPPLDYVAEVGGWE